jgi:hypothetical protein
MKKVMYAIEPLPEACWSEIVSLAHEKEYPKNSYFAEAIPLQSCTGDCFAASAARNVLDRHRAKSIINIG